MIFRIICCTFFSLFFIQAVKAQSQQIIPIYNTKTLEQNTLKIYSDSGLLAITAYKANVVKVKYFGKSQSDFLPVYRANLNIRVTQNLDDIFFATDSLWVIVNKFDLSVRFLKKENEQLFIKNPSYFLDNTNHSVSFLLSADDYPHLFDAAKLDFDTDNYAAGKGLGGKKKLCNPLLISPKGYALLIENPSAKKVRASAGAGNQIKFVGNNKSPLRAFYFLSGNAKEVNRNLNWLRRLDLPDIKNQ